MPVKFSLKSPEQLHNEMSLRIFNGRVSLEFCPKSAFPYRRKAFFVL